MIESNFVTCDDCPNPDGCLTFCKIQEYINENIHNHRGETLEQLEEDFNELR